MRRSIPAMSSARSVKSVVTLRCGTCPGMTLCRMNWKPSIVSGRRAFVSLSVRTGIDDDLPRSPDGTLSCGKDCDSAHHRARGGYLMAAPLAGIKHLVLAGAGGDHLIACDDNNRLWWALIRISGQPMLWQEI